MERKHYIMLLGCFLVISIVLAVLYAFSPMSSGIYRATFDRNFVNGPLVKKAELDLKYNSFYIAGITNDNIYLGNLTAPLLVSVTDLSLKELVPFQLRITKEDSIRNAEAFRLAIDSPYFYLLNGNIPQIYRGKMADWTAAPIMKKENFYFNAAISVSPSSFILQSYNRGEQSYELAKKSVDTPLRFENTLLKKQIDGIFCLDGQLRYAKELQRVVYHHFYKNEIIVADSNLNLLLRSHTIDTFSTAKLNISRIEGEDYTTLSAPPRQINAGSCVYKEYLLVNSNMLARNENIEQFSKNLVIDIYNLINGAYKGSFYIPQFKNKRPNEFRLLDKYIVAIYNHHLILFDFNISTLLNKSLTSTEHPITTAD